jgi:hypothetical protein
MEITADVPIHHAQGEGGSGATETQPSDPGILSSLHSHPRLTILGYGK